MLIKPHSSVEINRASISDLFPACSVFIPCDEGSGSPKEIVSGNSGALVAGSPDWSTTPNAVRISAELDFTSLSADASGGAQVIFAVINCNSSTFGGFYVSGSGSGTTQFNFGAAPSFADGTNTATSGSTFSKGVLNGYLMACTPNGGGSGGTDFYSGVFDASSKTIHAAVSGSPGSVAALGSISTISVPTAVNVMDIYGIAVFDFATGIPDDINAALAWMFADWTSPAQSEKRLYPGWMGRS